MIQSIKGWILHHKGETSWNWRTSTVGLSVKVQMRWHHLTAYLLTVFYIEMFSNMLFKSWFIYSQQTFKKNRMFFSSFRLLWTYVWERTGKSSAEENHIQKESSFWLQEHVWVMQEAGGDRCGDPRREAAQTRRNRFPPFMESRTSSTSLNHVFHVPLSPIPEAFKRS